MATTKDCNACGSPIPQSAKLCSVCKTYQGRVRRKVQFLSGTTTLLVGIVSLAASLALWLPSIRVMFWPRKDVRVIALNSLHGGVVLNRGDEEIFITEADLTLNITRGERGIVQRFNVNELLQPAKFLRIKPPERSGFKKSRWIGNVAEKDWNRFIDQIWADERCFQVDLFMKDDPFFKSIMSADPSINTLAATGYIEYQSVTAQHQRIPVPAIGVISINNEVSDCATKYHVR